MADAPARFKDLCLDANDHHALADWWCAAIGYVREGPPMWIGPVPERKTIKNRMHVDVVGETWPLIAAGARMVRQQDDEIDWSVLADPEGNEFCVFGPE